MKADANLSSLLLKDTTKLEACFAVIVLSKNFLMNHSGVFSAMEAK